MEKGYPKLKEFRPREDSIKHLHISDITLEDDELVISYKLLNKGIAESIKVQPYLTPNIQNIYTPLDSEIYGDGLTLINPSEDLYQLIISNVGENFLPFNDYQELGFSLKGMAIPPIDCAEKPKQPKTWPYLTAASVGLVSIASSFPFKNDAENDYKRYLLETNEAIAEPILDDANQSRGTYLTLQWIGIGVFAGSALLYLLSKKKYREKTNIFEKYCQELKIAPSYDISKQGKSLNLKAIYNF